MLAGPDAHERPAEQSAPKQARVDAPIVNHAEGGESSAPLPLQSTVEGPLDNVPSEMMRTDRVSDASMDSFPASDSPPWTGLRLGPP